ncbi:magnesium and cobalt transport protein CorA, partial [Undibacterium aquatile]|nr:flagellar motor switch protein FliG [Undibacterium aquatile]
LMLLGDAEAAQVLNNLEPYEVQHLGRSMFNVADVSKEDVESVLSQFTKRARMRTTIGFGSASRIRAVMQHALGVDRADTVLARITPPTRSQTLDAL